MAKSKLTPQLQEKIVGFILAGNYMETAAQASGINKGTLYRWLERANDPTAPEIYRDFRDAVENARAAAEARNVLRIQQAADNGTWQAAAWFLERSGWQRWGRRTMVTGDQGEAIKVQIDHRDSLRKMLGLDEDDASPDV